ncbi:MAG: FkbM family methyltransferase [Bacteroidales bacterium]|nr:FkbM family methyltransferase [Bacteroidales bacterium]
MFKRILKIFRHPKKAWRFLSCFLYHFFRKRKGTLVMVGIEPGGVLSLMHWGYEKCFGFEANPERFEKLKKKYGHFKNISLYNVAVAEYDGEITFHISSNNNGASSSIGTFKDDWQHVYNGEQVRMVKEITVPCIVLGNFLLKNNVSFIDDYISDIQGMDLAVLKTLKPLIDGKKIGSITCEVAANNKGNVYNNLPDNSESGFSELLSNNYTLVAKGWGVLKDNTFDLIPSDAWEIDCKWRVKQ